MKKSNKTLTVFFVLLVLGNGFNFLMAHCQVPCGIYDDEARFKKMFEHVTTMEKAMTEIAELSRQNPVNYNQMVRWVMNKEKHAEEFSEILSYYFLAQRLKPAAPEEKENYAKYQTQLEWVHHLLVYAMKAKQSTDLIYIKKLNELLSQFQKGYFAK